MAIERLGVVYASRQLVGDNGDKRGSYFRLKNEEQKALWQAWSEGCPIAVRLIVERGAKVMKLRYGEVNFWSGYIFGLLLQRGYAPEQLNNFMGPIDRLPSEPLGDHNPTWIPKELETRVYNTAVGYAFPRLITKFIEEDWFIVNGNINTQRQKRLCSALDILDEVIKKDPQRQLSPEQILAKVAEELATISPADKFPYLIRCMLSAAKLAEDNCKCAYAQIVKAIKSNAPILWAAYDNLTTDQKKKCGIALLQA
ncbi:MAG: hypothetical protein UX80_C0016G0017 [Candidatus Amesbacteria bacterium GW2011_GWA2_47_11b]|uniref:Uncharacterized protein n=3 Tax=Candidatus Amesiibacteriota TaxID=1752730 RepID=A0A0G1SK33_9BACT|nr:MAG: hypothetical protein UX42_C0021G0017 [Microgenomates group bacterium GW2011_GWC1_46_20]KKU57430.1 MAG: hypothetical protein UX80_C0016G0017 [Candidatus Amesbacteria bacterium GW2011_GWA2_47_11b]KKU69776.1 MAG: hypothetical protein UX92_C0010G0017 [Candidatus Amesbacteria bacterium GW2011_GWA1_47_20]KKU83457.1 MAG: hypothetical protein UY11_C0019G0002 [Candidatus Amesbacteria bacterium GW2011_GWC2_47_8]